MASKGRINFKIRILGLVNAFLKTIFMYKITLNDWIYCLDDESNKLEDSCINKKMLGKASLDDCDEEYGSMNLYGKDSFCLGLNLNTI